MRTDPIFFVRQWVVVELVEDGVEERIEHCLGVREHLVCVCVCMQYVLRVLRVQRVLRVVLSVNRKYLDHAGDLRRNRQAHDILRVLEEHVADLVRDVEQPCLQPREHALHQEQATLFVLEVVFADVVHDYLEVM